MEWPKPWFNAFNHYFSFIFQLRKEYGFEGEVFYYVGDDGQVFGMLKKKTAWYIILRAIREKVRNALNPRQSANKREVSTKVWIASGLVSSCMYIFGAIEC